MRKDTRSNHERDAGGAAIHAPAPAALSLMFGLPLFRSVPWWMGFPVFTIAGERLELGRLQRLPARVQQTFAIVAVALVAACSTSSRCWPSPA